MFKVGQSVICRNTNGNNKFNTIPKKIQKGRIYTVSKVSTCKCCGLEEIELEEIEPDERWCGNCDHYKGYSGSYLAFRFELVKYDFIKWSEFTKNIDTKDQEVFREVRILN